MAFCLCLEQRQVYRQVFVRPACEGKEKALKYIYLVNSLSMRLFAHGQIAHQIDLATHPQD